MRRHRCDRTPGSSAVRDHPAHANDRRDVPPRGGVCRGRGNRAAAAPMTFGFDWRCPCSTSRRARECRALPRLAEIRSSGCSPVPGCGGAAKSIVLLGILVQTAPSCSSTAPYKDACCQGVSALAVLLPFILLSVFCLVVFQSIPHHATMPPPYSHSCWNLNATFVS